MKSSTEIITAELEKLGDSFEQFNPGNGFSESTAVFGTMEGEIAGIGSIAQQVALTIAGVMIQMGSSFSSVETGISGVQSSMTNLATVISSAAGDLLTLEEALKSVNAANTTVSDTTKDAAQARKDEIETLDKLKDTVDAAKGLEDFATAFGLIQVSATAAAGAVSTFSGVLGIVGFAIQALSLIKFFDDKVKQEQEEAKNALREYNAELINYNELMETQLNLDNAGYYAEMAESFDAAIEAIDNAREGYALLNEQKEYFESADPENYERAQAILNQAKAAEELTAQLNEMGFAVTSSSDIINDSTVFYDMLVESSQHLKDSIHDVVLGMTEGERISEGFNNTINSQIAEINTLDNAYARLARGEELSSQNLMQLAQQYPEVAWLVRNNALSHENLMAAIKNESDVSRQASIDELKRKRDELTAEARRLNSILRGYEQETRAHNDGAAQKKEGLKDFHDYAQKVIESLEGTGSIAGASTAAVGNTAERATEESFRKRLAEIKEDQIAIDAQIDIINNMKDIEVDLTPNITIDEPKITYGSSFSGGSIKKQLKEELEEELEEELSEFQLNWDKYQKIQEENQNISLEERKRWLDDNLKEVKKSQEEELQYRKEYENILKEISQKAIESIEGIASAEGESAEAIIANLQGLKDAYKEYEDVVTAVEKKITEITIEETEKRNAEIKKEADARKAQADAINDEIENHYRVMKSYDGIRFGAGDNDVFKYTTEMEINRIDDLIAAQEAYVRGFKGRMEPLNEYEEKLLADAEATLKKHYDTRQDLHMKHLKEQQEALEKAFKEKEKIYQQEFKAAEDAYKETTAMIKSEYDQRIKAAKAAADKELDILQKQINEIDKLMAKQAIDEQDDNYNKKRNQLEQLIAYEIDDGNKYELQKELSRLNEEYEKRKQKEALEAQKSALQEEMSNVRDRLNQETQALENMRDSELKTMEAQIEQKRIQYERDTELRKEELKKQQALIVTNAALELEETNETVDQKLKVYKRDTGNHKTQLEEQEKNIDIFRSSVYRKYDETSMEVRQLGENTVTYILEYLNDRVSDFAAAGRRAGAAYADAFQRASSTASSYVDGFAFAMSSNLMNVSAQASSFMAAGAMSQALVSAPGNSQETQNNEVNIYQTITAPVATPSMVAKETKRELQQALRYS